MKTFKFLALFVAASVFTGRSAQAQDPIAIVEQMAVEMGQKADYHAAMAIQFYRHQYGDWTTPDQQVLNYLEQEARRTNPSFYRGLAERERAFQRQQGEYVANSNAILDGMHNSYMDRSNRQDQSHENYVQGAIWGNSNYTDGTNTYVLPDYQPGNVYEGQNGSTIMQDQNGEYHGYSAGGWYNEMSEID